VPRLATQLLLIARNPHSGRLRHRGVLDIALRAALLTELVLDGRITHESGGPVVISPGKSGDRILDAVASTVERRPNVSWWRWFRHVRSDRQVLIAELIESDRWTQRRGGLRPAYDDTDEGAALALSFETMRVADKQVVAKDARQGALAILTVMSGASGRHPRPRSLRSDLKPIVDAVANSGEPGAEVLPVLFAGASRLSRRPTRR
jgi:hypothetical protein